VFITTTNEYSIIAYSDHLPPPTTSTAQIGLNCTIILPTNCENQINGRLGEISTYVMTNDSKEME